MERPPLLSDLFRMVVKMIVGGFLIIALFSCGAGVIGAAGSSGKPTEEKVSAFLYGDEDSENAILRVNIMGPIATHAPENADGGFFGGLINFAFGYEIKEQLLDAAENEDIKAVMLFVQTPGGSINGSQAIFDGVKAVQAAGKPVVAYVDSVSASGGVWSTAGADKIFADYGAIVGSVGVNFGNISYYDDPVALDGGLFGGGVTTRGGIKTKFLGAGLGKDIGNPFREMTEREWNLLSASAEEFYEDFVNHVVENRGMDRTALVEQHGAMLYSNKQAEQYGYIDGTKTFQDTLEYIGSSIGAGEGDWKLVSPPKIEKTPFEELFGAKLNASEAEFQSQRAAAQVCQDLKAGPVVMTVDALIDLCGV